MATPKVPLNKATTTSTVRVGSAVSGGIRKVPMPTAPKTTKPVKAVPTPKRGM